MAISAISAIVSAATQFVVYGVVNWAMVATTFVLSALSRAMTPKAPSLANQLRDRTETVRSAVAPHKIVYGEVPLSGPLIFAASTGGSNEYLHLVIALTGHECDAMTTVWLNDVAVGTLDGSGNVTSGQFSGLARVKYHLGSASQTADADLVSECGAQGWTTDHRLQGRGYIYLRLQYDSTAYPNGIPNVKVLVKGKKIYDPRTATTVWSRNWALCVRDYLASAYGLRCTSGEVDDAAITLAANIADEAVPLAVGTQTRYTCDGVLDLSLRPIDHIKSMLSGGAGSLVYTQGTYRLFAGAYVNPAVTLTADDLRGTLTVRPRVARKSLFNAVRGTFVDPDKYWQASDFPPMANATYAVQDGNEEIWADIELPFTIDSIRAQRLAKIHLEKSRQGITIDFPAKLTAVKIAVWDVIRLTLSHLGWSAKEFRVIGWKFAADGLGVDLVLQEESAASWEWAYGDATIVDPAPDTDLISPVACPPPTSLTVYSGATHQLAQADGITLCRLYATWTAATDATVQHYEIQHKLTTDSVYASAVMSSAVISAYIAPVQSGASYHVRVRAIRASGAISAWDGPVTIAASSDASTVSATVAYADITGTKPPADADKTVTAIQAGATVTSGGITFNAGGAIKGGQTDYNTGTGWFLGYSGAAYKFSIGNPAGNRLTWDGSTLTLTGALNGATGTLGSLEVAPGGHIRSGQSAFNTGVGFWIGDVSGTNKFSIGNPAGNYLTWNGAVLTVGGEIIATGNIQDGAITNRVANNYPGPFILDFSSIGCTQNTGNLSVTLVTSGKTVEIIAYFEIFHQYFPTLNNSKAAFTVCRNGVLIYSSSISVVDCCKAESEPYVRERTVYDTPPAGTNVYRLNCIALTPATYASRAKNLSLVCTEYKK